MSELIKTAEVVGKGLRFAQKIGKTLLEPFTGGWNELGKITVPEPKPAEITVYEDEEHLIRGEE